MVLNKHDDAVCVTDRMEGLSYKRLIECLHKYTEGIF